MFSCLAYAFDHEPTASDVWLSIDAENSTVMASNRLDISGSMTVDNSVVSPLIRCFLDDVNADCRRGYSEVYDEAVTSFSVHVPAAWNDETLLRVEAYLPPNNVLSTEEVNVIFG